MLRKLELPENVSGKVYLTHMPGYYEIDASPADSYEAMIDASVSGIVCLNPLRELMEKSPIYARDHSIPDALPAPVYNFPISDYGIPDDILAFKDFISLLCKKINEGHIFAIHCAMGIGRTGLTATCILMMLGLNIRESLRRVSEAQSSPQSFEQNQFLAHFAALIS